MTSQQNEGLTPAGLEILAALTEVRDALKSGKPVEEAFTVRRVKLDLEPRLYDKAEVKRVREAIKASQPLFAKLLGVDVNTVRSWEQGKREPSPMARRFMDEIIADPKRWQKRLRMAITARPGGQ